MAELPDDGPIPAHVRLINLATATWPCRALYAAAKLGIADQLSQGPASAETLSAAVGRDSGSIKPLLTALTNFGVLSATDNRTFALTKLGSCLRTGAPGSARAVILLMSLDRSGARASVAHDREAVEIPDMPHMHKVIEIARSKRALAGSAGIRARRSSDSGD
jgi:hypothetical protein